MSGSTLFRHGDRVTHNSYGYGTFQDYERARRGETTALVVFDHPAYDRFNPIRVVASNLYPAEYEPPVED